MTFVDEAVVVHELGEGGQGTVYLMKAQDGRLFVLKRRAEETAEARFLAAFEAHKRLDGHPAFQKVYEGDEEILALEYIPGSTLENYQGMLSWSGALPILRQLCEAVAMLHSEGLVHRDLKPSNLLLASGRLVVIDLGSAEVGWDLTKGAAGPVPHTPGFASPELAGGAPTTPAEDVYQIAMVAKYLLGGFAEVPAETREVLKRCLETPISRPSLQELSNQLTKSDGTSVSQAPQRRASWTTSILALGAFVFGAAGAWAFGVQTSPPTAEGRSDDISANQQRIDELVRELEQTKEDLEATRKAASSDEPILRVMTAPAPSLTPKAKPKATSKPLTFEEKRALQQAEKDAKARRALQAIPPKNP